VPHRVSTRSLPLQCGQAAPLFSLPDGDMTRVDIAKFRGKKNVVLYFYPRDGTPGCTLQATEFSDHEGDFARYDTVVLGVSPDDCLCHAEFSEANGVSIRLLADTECEVCALYGVLEDRNGRGAGGSAAAKAADRNGKGEGKSSDANGASHSSSNGDSNGNAAHNGAMVSRSSRSVTRATFVIDKRGVVRHALYDVSPKGHAMGVLGLVKAMHS
jgi:peroxiredoxin Q/BCP